MDVIKMLQKFAGHGYISLTTRGNTAIFAALLAAHKVNPERKTVLIPDQGGWLTYKTYPGKLGLDVVEVQTDDGIIVLDDLQMRAKGALCFIYANPAGYIAVQPSKEIYKICNKENCMFIEDVCGTIGTEYCKGSEADILVCSFGRWKPINVGYGGFVSFKEEKYYDAVQEFLSTVTFDESKLQALGEKITHLS